MSIINVLGQVTLESAGSNWHLVGTVKRDRVKHHTLTLTRQVDSLSKILRSSSGRHLPLVHITTPSGAVAKLMDVRVIASPERSWSTGRASSTSAKEEITFTFRAIEVKYSASTTTTDDWTANND